MPQARSIEGEYPDQMLKGMIGLADCVIVPISLSCLCRLQSVPFLGMASGFYHRPLKGFRFVWSSDCFVKEDMNS